MRLLLLVLGCGFHGIPNIGVDGGFDLAGADFSLPAGVDLAGADLTTVQGMDLSQAAHFGPGPLGALPAGFCCNSNEECRSRMCNGGACSDECVDNSECNAWVPAYTCDPGTGTCIANGALCRPANQYQYGTKATGTCCSHGFAMSGQECLGGLCESTGNDANPFYCTQGCDPSSPCPGAYSCFAGFCWITQTVSDNTYLYMCQ